MSKQESWFVGGLKSAEPEQEGDFNTGEALSEEKMKEWKDWLKEETEEMGYSPEELASIDEVVTLMLQGADYETELQIEDVQNSKGYVEQQVTGSSGTIKFLKELAKGVIERLSYEDFKRNVTEFLDNSECKLSPEIKKQVLKQFIQS